MSGWIVVTLIVVAAAVAGAVWITSFRSGATAPPDAKRPNVEPPAPMTGLESALAEAHDRTGRSLGECLDAEADHVDPLRVPDDTSPLLHRALDHVAGQQEVDPPGIAV